MIHRHIGILLRHREEGEHVTNGGMVGLEIVTLNETSQTQKDKCFLFFLKCRYAESKYTHTNYNTHICTHRERESRRLGKEEKPQRERGREGARWGEKHSMFSDM